jgi:predicted RNA-binding protein (virulence factor B family)
VDRFGKVYLGQFNHLQIVKQVEFGVYLNGREFGEILLPNKVAPKENKIGDFVDAFIYFDSEDKIIATTRKPLTQVGRFDYLKVVSVTSIGAFLDWGLDKDLFLPFGQQHKPAEQDRSYLVYTDINRADGRIIASSKIDQFLDKLPATYENGRAVDLIIAGRTDLGYKAIINHQHTGVLYPNEVFEVLRFGQKIQGFIKQMRADGKIDLSLMASHKTQNDFDQNALEILSRLTQAGGFLALTDKTAPELIYSQLKMSKGKFKRAIGQLFKQRKILLEPDGIRLIQSV